MPHVSDIRHDWTKDEVLRLFNLPFNDLLFEAQSVHRKHFNPNEVQISTLLSIKTGGCAEDCSYCPQAAQYDTGVKAQKLMQKEAVMEEAPPAEGEAAAPEAPEGGMARAERPRYGRGGGYYRGCEGFGHGDVRHAWDADPCAGCAFEGGGVGLL